MEFISNIFSEYKIYIIVVIVIIALIIYYFTCRKNENEIKDPDSDINPLKGDQIINQENTVTTNQLNQIPPQQMPPHQMPPHQMPPQQMPPHQMPPQQMPPQQMPPQQMPPQQMPPQQMPNNQMPNNQMPNNQMDPNQMMNLPNPISTNPNKGQINSLGNTDRLHPNDLPKRS